MESENILLAETAVRSFVVLVRRNCLIVSTVLWTSRDQRENNNSKCTRINDYLLFAQRRDTCNPARPASELEKET